MNMHRCKEKSEKAVNICILSISLFFLIFYIFKLQGYFDFTGKYYIKKLSATTEALNVYLLLDDEESTEWGAYYGYSNEGDCLEIEFKCSVNVNDIILRGTYLPERLSVAVYRDSQWINVDAQYLDGIISVNEENITGLSLKNETNNEAGKWEMYEIEMEVQRFAEEERKI